MARRNGEPAATPTEGAGCDASDLESMSAMSEVNYGELHI